MDAVKYKDGSFFTYNEQKFIDAHQPNGRKLLNHFGSYEKATAGVQEAQDFIEDNPNVGQVLIDHFGVEKLEEAEAALDSFAGCYDYIEDYAIRHLDNMYPEDAEAIEDGYIPSIIRESIDFKKLAEALEKDGVFFKIVTGHCEIWIFENR